MIFSNIFLVFAILSPALSAPNLPRALARLGEARARALSNRARARANSARIMNQLSHPSNSNRSKRDQMTEEFEENEPSDYEEPDLLHFYPLEDEEYENVARSSEDGHDFKFMPRFDESFQTKAEQSLDAALEKLVEAKEVLKRIEGDNAEAILHHQRSQIQQLENLNSRKLPSNQLLPNYGTSLTQHLPINHEGQFGRELPSTQLLPNHGTSLTQHLPINHEGQFGHENHQSKAANADAVPVLPFLPLNVHHHQSLLPGLPNQGFFNHQHSNFGLNQGFVPGFQRPNSVFVPSQTTDGIVPTFQQQISTQGGFMGTNQPISGTIVPLNQNFGGLREADPTIHKLKKLKIKKFQPQHYPSYQSYHREAEDVGIAPNEEKDADPTLHKLKQLKLKKLQQLKPQYPSYPSFYGQYREAGEEPEEFFPQDVVEDTEEPEMREATFDPYDQKDDVMDFLSRHKFRETLPLHYEDPYAEEIDPVLHKLEQLKELKLRKLQILKNFKKELLFPKHENQGYYYNQYREVEDPEENTLKTPNIFNFPLRNIDFQHYKRSIDGEKILNSSEKQKNITKRSIPLTRLISDPNVKLDVPKTIENFGTATKQAFEDEKAPMYHFKHLVGSSKNALLSAMRIPPQNMIIPSDYQIVKSEDRVGAANPSEEDPMEFSHTFRRVGEMFRDSIKSGQETATHLGEMAHDARNILNSARHSAPRLIIPYSQIPAIQDSKRRTPSKAILITPRLLDLTEDSGKKLPNTRANFVRLSHILDAAGISNPKAKALELEKIIFEPRRLNQAKVDRRLAQLYSKFRENFNDDSDTVSEAISTLEDAKISVGAKNLRDFLVKMKSELTSMVRNNPETHKKKKHMSKKKQETKEVGKFIEHLFDGSKTEKNETVGLYLPPELLHPFMGRASENQLQNFLRENGDDVTIHSRNKPPSEHYHHNNHEQNQNNANLGYVLGAINPLMLERMYNQTVHINNENPEDHHLLFSNPLEEEENDTLGNFALNGPMLKPFMGQVQPEVIEKFLDTYNGHREEGSFEEDV